jgi:hypothetical protein
MISEWATLLPTMLYRFNLYFQKLHSQILSSQELKIKYDVCTATNIKKDVCWDVAYSNLVYIDRSMR